MGNTQSKGAKFQVHSKSAIKAILGIEGKSYGIISESALELEEMYAKANPKYTYRSNTNSETISSFFSNERALSEKTLLSFIHTIFHLGTSQSEIERKVTSLFSQISLLSGTKAHLEKINTLLRENIAWKKKQLDESLYSEGWTLFFNPKRYTPTQYSGLIHFSSSYWDYMSNNPKSDEQLLQFYVNSNSSLNLLPYVIASDFHIPHPDELFTNDGNPVDISGILAQGDSLAISSIIAIHARAGSGKSTFIFELAKKYSKKFNTFLITNLRLTKDFPEEDGRHALVLLDNYAQWGDHLEDLIHQLANRYSLFGFTLIMTETTSLSSVSSNATFLKAAQSSIGSLVVCQLSTTPNFYAELFSKLASRLNITDVAQLNVFKPMFTKTDGRTTTERIFELLALLEKVNIDRYDFQFDWGVWDAFCERFTEYKVLKQLYTIVAYFNFYQVHPKIKLCLELLNADFPQTQLMTLFQTDIPLQISTQSNDLLVVRNENVIPHFLKKFDPDGKNRLSFFEIAITRCLKKGKEQHIHFLRNICRNPLLNRDPLFIGLIPPSSALISVFKNFASKESRSQDASKTYMELYILYAKQNQYDEAVKNLWAIIEAFPEDATHAKTKLASYYLSVGRSAESGEILEQLIVNNYHQIPVLRDYLRYLIRNPNADRLGTVSKIISLFHQNDETYIKAYILNYLARNQNFHPHRHEIKSCFDILLSTSARLNWKHQIIYAQFLFLFDFSEEFELNFNHIQKNCHSSALISYFANWFLDKKELDKAEVLIETFIEKNPNTYDVAINSVFAHILVQRINAQSSGTEQRLIWFDKAQSLLHVNLEKYPNNSHSWHLLFILNNIMSHFFKRDVKYVESKSLALKKTFELNHQSSYVINSTLNYIKSTRRYHLLMKYADTFCSKKKGFMATLYLKAHIDAFRAMDSNRYKEYQNTWQKNDKLKNTPIAEDDFKLNNTFISHENIGVLVGNQLKAVDGSREYQIAENPNIFNRIHFPSGTSKVYFSLHNLNGDIVANNIEPYFVEIPKNKDVLKKLIWM